MLQALLARITSNVEYGKYTFAMSIISILVVFASVGFTNSILRYLPEYLLNGSYSLLKGFYILSFKVTIYGGLLFGTMVYTVLLLAPHGLYWYTALLFSLSLPMLALMQYYSEIFRAFGQIVYSVLSEQILRPFGIIFFVLLFYEISKKSNLVTISSSLLLACVISLLVFIVPLKSVKQKFLYSKPSFKVKEWMGVSSSMIFFNGFQTLLSQSDMVIVGIIINPSMTGYYSVGVRIASLANFGLVAVNQVFASGITKMYLSRDKIKFQRELSRASIFTILITFFMGGALYSWSGFILSIFGHNFLRAYEALHILIIGQVINAAAGPVGYILNLTGYQRDAVRIFGISTFLNIVGCIAAADYTKNISIVALVNVLVTVIWNVWAHYLVVKRIGVWPSVVGVLMLPFCKLKGTDHMST